MTTTMDIAVCLDCSSSIAFYFNQIRGRIFSILRNALNCHQSDIRMALIEFQSHSDYWLTNTHPFTSSMETFQGWFNAVQTEGTYIDDNKAIGDTLSAALALNWRPNTDVNRYHEKLVILITDGPPCNLLNDACPCDSNDLWQMADEFVEQDITLVVIGIEPSVVVCEDFYCALAKKTGGEYLPFINASRVLSSVIQRAILEEDTLSQLLRHLDIYSDIECNSLYHYSYAQKRVRFMIENCRTMTDIRKQLYTYCHQSADYVTTDGTNINHDNFEPHSPSSNANYFNQLWYPNINIITSTPITDDEGYRTRLPTTASADSSFMQISSPVLSHRTDSDWTSEIDDDCF